MCTYVEFEQWLHEHFIVDECYLQNDMIFITYTDSIGEEWCRGITYNNSAAYAKSRCKQSVNLRRKI